MKKEVPQEVEKYRIRYGLYGSDSSLGFNGQFILPGIKRRSRLLVMVSDGIDPISKGWEHASVSHMDDDLIPSWDDMAYVKDKFWDDEETVIQFHPKKSEYVNNFQVLHLWKKIDIDFELPPSILVGIKNENN